MNFYKKIIRTREQRLKILNWLGWVSDNWMISLQCRIKMGKWPNLKNPKAWSEKIQWYKIYYRDPRMTKYVDKYVVYEYVKEKGYGDILIPVYGVWDRLEDIDFDSLSDKFVLKTTQGNHETVVVNDKSKLNRQEAIDKLNFWLSIESHHSECFC